MTDARLEPVSPTTGDAIQLGERELWVIGSATDADLRLDDPGIGPRHCTLEFRNNRWLMVDADPTSRINGLTVAGATLLFDRDVIAITALHQWEFVSGERRTVEMPVPPLQRQFPARRATVGFAHPKRPVPWRVFGIVVTACVFIGAALFAAWYGRRTRADTSAILSDRQAIEFDSLLALAYDHLERGNSLLELGVSDAAAQEFARGINTLALSTLREHRQVRPRIQALESSVAAMYRERSLAVPSAYAGASSTIAADKIRTATLSRKQFEHAFDLVSGAFRLQFGQPIVVSGRDHAEHVTLYGEGGALDLRSITMSPAQIAFVVRQCRSYGIRVKDFSQDSILQQQVKAAVRAGLPERAGTGLHLHVDRFADRRDKWTIGARRDTPQGEGPIPSNQQEFQSGDTRKRELRPVL